jgi:GT2 family glycosyltransferase
MLRNMNDKVKTENMAIVVVTYKRQQLLSTLYESIKLLEVKPSDVVIVDNENSLETEQITESFKKEMSVFGSKVHYVQMEENTGGSGGFSKGVEVAYSLGVEWLWLMDDDVAVLPDAIISLQKWMPDYKVIQGQRYNFDGTPFYWQYDFMVPLGIPNPIAHSGWGTKDFKKMNTACFEGGLFHRSVVEKIGLPDKRFFIYWDDTIYGYLASGKERCVLVKDFVMRRTRELDKLDLGLRHLNSTSDTNRYYIMRNRAYMAKYFICRGDYNPLLFGFGTFLTLIKELIRLFTVDKTYKTGVKALFKGISDGRKIHKDLSWKPMSIAYPIDKTDVAIKEEKSA